MQQDKGDDTMTTERKTIDCTALAAPAVGGWRIERVKEDWARAIVDDTGGWVCECTENDAPLLAAAQEMLAALESLAHDTIAMCNVPEHHVEAIFAAINKARGITPCPD
jgi:hypothetical protein